MPDSPLLDVRGLTKSFGDLAAVQDVSFAVKRGTVLGFLGPNGAGKTTTMRMITGAMYPDSGEVWVAGQNMVTDRQSAQTYLGYLPEGVPFWPDMTPLTYLEFLADMRRLSRRNTKSAIARVVRLLALHPVMLRPIHSLSKGYRRRTGLAGALLHDPPVLVLDEPTDGLDPNQKFAVRELIRHLAQNKAIIISTHILEEVATVCSHVVIVHDGKVVADDTPARLRGRVPSRKMEHIFRQLTTRESQ